MVRYVSGQNPLTLIVTKAPGTPPAGEIVQISGNLTVKVVVAETTPTVAVIVATPKGASSRIVMGSLNVPSVATAGSIPIGAMTPGATITPVRPGGKPVPFTVTTVLRAPEVGLRVIVGAGGSTMKWALAERTPTVAVMVCSPKGASPSIVTVVVNPPVALVEMVSGEITPGAVMMPGATTGKPVPVTVTGAPRAPEVGERVMVGRGAGSTVKGGEM
jgi:hypothetical protein